MGTVRQQLHDPKAILAYRRIGELETNSAAQTILGSIGRPLWKSFYELHPLEFHDLVKNMAANMKLFVYNVDRNLRLCLDCLIDGMKPGPFTVLAYRLPIRLKARSGLAGLML